MTRPVRALINLTALRHNLGQVRRYAPRSRVLAIIKANAYGHGLLRVAQALHAADGFGVASLEEALTLRGAGVTHPILLLAGPFSDDEVTAASEAGLDLVLHHDHQLEMLERALPARPLAVWLKLDSGMHRLGFGPQRLPALWTRLQALLPSGSRVRLMTHLASAEEVQSPQTPCQLRLFFSHCAGVDAELSIANSAAVLAWPETHAHWVRPGIMLYGIAPFPATKGADYGLEPVMTLETRLIAVNHIQRGERIGYGGTWACPKDMPIGIAAIGYGDGYPRHAPSGTPVLVNGERVALVGRVCMDFVTLDLRTQPNAQPGDPVILWGPGLAVEEIAACAGTIPYELVCGVSARVPSIEVA